METKDKKIKKIPDDIILVFSGIFAGMLFLWGNINNVYCEMDFYYLLGGTFSMIFIPMFYSSWVYYCNKKKH